MSKEFSDLIIRENQKKITNMKKFNQGGFGVKNTSSDVITVKETLDSEKPLAIDLSSTEESKKDSDESRLTNLVNTLLSPMQSRLDQAENQVKELQNALNSSQKEALQVKTELEKTKGELETAKTDSKVLQDLEKFSGVNINLMESPQRLEVLGDGSQEMRNYESLIEKAPTKIVNGTVGLVSQKDLRQARRYFKENKARIVAGVEAILKQAGFLTGGAITNNTLPANIPSILFKVLSEYIRESTFEDLIHWQFANTKIATGVKPSLNTDVPRYPYSARPANANSRRLVTGTPINSGSQAINELSALITIEELGLGRDANNPPIGLTEFVNAFSMNDLEQIVQRNLGMDYQAYKDLRLWSLWFTTDRVLYPGLNGNLIDNPANLTTVDGSPTKEFFTRLRSLFKQLKIRPYSNGLYGYSHNPGSFGQFMSNLSSQERNVGADNATAISTVLARAGSDNEEGGEVLGFRGNYYGFMHFEQNNYGVGATPGVDPGVNNVTVDGNPVIFDSSFAFGANTFAMVDALPVEIREDEMKDFGRRNRYIWYAHQGFGELDIKANAQTGTELRVIEIRNRRV